MLLQGYGGKGVDILYYIMMNKTCRHRLIYDGINNEYFCSMCGHVLSAEEVAELQGVTEEVMDMRSAGYDPRGKTNYWLNGLGTVTDSSNQLKSILANIFNALEIPYSVGVSIERAILACKEERRQAQAYVCYTFLMREIMNNRKVRSIISERIGSDIKQDIEDYVASIVESRFGTRIKEHDYHTGLVLLCGLRTSRILKKVRV